MILTDAQHDALSAAIEAWKATNPLALWRAARPAQRTREFVAAAIGVSTQAVRGWEGGTRPKAMRMGALSALTGDPVLHRKWDTWEAARPNVESAK